MGFRYRILFPVKVDNFLWWASLLMFAGATGFNISNIAGVLYGDVPLNLTVAQQVIKSALHYTALWR